MLIPREYQAEAAEKAIDFMRKNKEPGVVVLCTAAGKSIVVSLVAEVVTKVQKRVLCLAPNGDLTEQNSKKYRATGNKCSIFSAKLGKKQTGHNVVFATPVSVKNSLSRFDESYALVIIDECDSVSDDETTTIQIVLSYLRERNPNIRILGLTATPYRGKHALIDEANTFKHEIYNMPHNELCDMGWVVPYQMGVTAEHYELANIKLQSNGKYKQSEIDAATLNKDRLTRAIVNDVVGIMASNNRNCGLFFAASIEHAKEVLGYLPAGEAIMVDGTTANRSAILDQIRAGRWRYVVNVGVLTVGTDLEIVDTVVLLRATESARLLIQILGRGCRLYDPSWTLHPSKLNWKHEEYAGKTECIVLDYGQNIERFSLDDSMVITDLVRVKNEKDAGDDALYIDCPDCGTPNPHTAVRCVGVKHKRRCEYYFAFKVCQCGVYNAPSARYCRKCKAELVNPEKKLTRAPAIGAGVPIYVEVQSMTLRPHVKKEKVTLRVDYAVQYGDRDIEISEFLNPATTWPAGVKAFQDFCNVTGAKWGSVDEIVASAAELTAPVRLLVQRDKGSKYFSVIGRYK